MGKTAGVDEAGRGPWAGPVVAACVILNKDIPHLGDIDDSKKLSPKKREELYRVIKENSIYGIGVVSNKEIDKLGIVKAVELAIKRAIDVMDEKPSFLLIDGKDRFDLPIKYKTIIEGDAKVKSIAAASILAKVWRDRYMELVADIYPKYGFEKHKGYGTKAHTLALEKYGPCQIHRFSFKPIQRVLEKKNRKPRLLLHACCAPCATSVIERLKANYDVEVFFYNPNIHPKREYEVRLKEIERLCQYHKIKLHVGKYNPKRWIDRVKMYKNESEGGKRCILCYADRMKESVRLASELGFDYFTTTLSVSPLKSWEKIKTIGEALAAKYNIAFEDTDFKKKDGFKRSVELSKEFGFYRQTYCGCVYSNIEQKRKRGILHGEKSD
ncbi:ribonuclease HII [Hippea maritima]|uniref:Multifunctional fusion protein n=1 Tax=Hippea maritima (strain ATCC 700847 / DSM 10411 / MH2) TaxID=760142 RepID=F2LUU8_HIPMA|nr:ribonuclease HII [Hippea maritima]AEA33553.1 Ribonuclease H [Hippea maritima DSM 10411]